MTNKFEWGTCRDGVVTSKCGRVQIRRTRRWDRRTVWQHWDLRFCPPEPRPGEERLPIRRQYNTTLSRAKTAVWREMDSWSKYPTLAIWGEADCHQVKAFPEKCPCCHAERLGEPEQSIDTLAVVHYACGGVYEPPQEEVANRPLWWNQVGWRTLSWVGSCPRPRLCEALGMPYWTPPGVVLDLAKERGLMGMED